MHRHATPLRASAAAVLVALALTGCSGMLDGVGDLSRRVVYGSDVETATTTTRPEDGPPIRLTPVTQVAWANDGLGVLTEGLEREAVIDAVWRRGDGISAFIQADRSEVATALPGIEFPQLVPSGVTHVSSQLVFDPLTGMLDVTASAAFGMWVGEPYALPRSDAQLAVLRVGLRSAADVETGEFASFQVSDGREIVWARGPYVYQLFCRTGVSEQACVTIAESTYLLAAMVRL